MVWERTVQQATADGQAPTPPVGPGPPAERDGANWHRLGRRGPTACAAGTRAM
jgi:hypothetical protein